MSANNNMRMVPRAAHTTSVTNLNSSSRSAAAAASFTQSAPSAPGLADKLRDAREPLAAAAANSTSPHAYVAPSSSGHPLEARLAGWRATQHNLKMEGLRRQFGMAEPVKRDMELGLVRAGEWRPAALGGSAGVHGDVLEGRDSSIEWDDVFTGGAEMRDLPGMHSEMEARLKMNQL